MSNKKWLYKQLRELENTIPDNLKKEVTASPEFSTVNIHNDPDFYIKYQRENIDIETFIIELRKRKIEIAEEYKRKIEENE